MSRQFVSILGVALGVVCLGLLSGYVYRTYLSDGLVRVVDGEYSSHFSIGDPMFVLYTLPGCSYCADMERLLEEHDLRFQERDLSSSTEYQQSVAALGGTRVPVLVAADFFVEGFQRRTVEKALRDRGHL